MIRIEQKPQGSANDLQEANRFVKSTDFSENATLSEDMGNLKKTATKNPIDDVISNATLGVSLSVPQYLKVNLTNEQLEKILAINLPTRSDRRDQLTLAAHLTGIELEWMAAVSGADIIGKAYPLVCVFQLPK